MIVKIFSNLDTRDLVNCQLVNRHWQELIDDDMLALAYYRRCHPIKQRINPLSVERYHSSIQGWLKGFSNLGKESAAQLDRLLQHKHFTERLFFSIAKVLAKAKVLTCQGVGTIKHSYLTGKPSFSPDGNYLVTVSLHHSVKISELVAGRWQEKVTIRHLYRVNGVSFSPDGKRLVTASDDSNAKLLRLVNGQWQEETTIEHPCGVSDVCFSPDGRHLVTASTAAKIWELVDDRWQEKASIRHSSSPVARVCFSPDGNHLVTVSFDGTVKISKLVAGQWLAEIAIDYYEYEGTTIRYSRWGNVCFSPDGNYLVIVAADTATIWKLVDGEWKLNAAIKHSDPVGKVIFSPDGNHLLTDAVGPSSKILGVVDGRWQEKATLGNTGSLNSANFSPDGSHFVTLFNFRTTKIWGEVGGKWQEKITIQHSSPMEGVSFSPDGKHLVTRSYTHTGKILGVVDGRWQEKATFANTGQMTDAIFSPDGYHLVTAFSHTAKVWVLKSKDNADSC